MAYRPLEGIRVLDISRLYNGALATLKLADLGADVVKVEEPGRGDYMRTIPPLVAGEGALHLLCNRGKRSVALDFKTPEGLETFLRLARATDVLVESARPGRFRDLGIDFATLRRERPELVVCSVSGFGQTGPLAPLAAHGMNMDALAGVLMLAEWKGRTRFMTFGFSLGVEMGAANAALGIAAAVFKAKRTGEGAWIDASCWDGAVEIGRLSIAAHLGAGDDLAPRDPRPLYDVYETSDDKLVLFCAIERKFWESFCRGVGRKDLLGRWGGTDVDFGADETLRGELEAIFAERTADAWQKHFLDWDIPGSPVLRLGEVLEHPHVHARGLVRHEREGEAPFVANPLRWHDDGTRPGDGAAPAPALGAHTDEVIREWLR
jgi:crotonobetainyl-CoA:carnitine CoA-transferase CaiB-like acyl-CoA transferase